MNSRYYPPDTRRLKRVKIADVPIDIRRHAAQRVCKEEHDAYQRLKVRMLAEDPGDLVAWIAA